MYISGSLPLQFRARVFSYASQAYQAGASISSLTYTYQYANHRKCQREAPDDASF
jgi:hypothetical protein